MFKHEFRRRISIIIASNMQIFIPFSQNQSSYIYLQVHQTAVSLYEAMNLGCPLLIRLHVKEQGLFVNNNILNSMIMNAKNNEELICGWANESSANQEAILTNILKRKATLQLLPQLNIFRQTEHRKQISNLKISPSKQKIQRKTHCLLKVKREKTEGCEKQDKNSVNFKNEKICGVILLEECPKITFVPMITDYQPQLPVNCESNHTECQVGGLNRLSNNLSSKQQETSTFLNTMQPKKINIKSHQFIPQLDQSESSKKLEPKHYMKLSALEVANDLKRQFRHDFLQRYGIKPCISEQKGCNDSRNRYAQKRSKLHVDDKINEKFRQTFVKQDIFTKNRKRGQRVDHFESRLNSDDQIYPTDYIISADRKWMLSRMHTIKSPPKCHLIFK